MADTFLNTPGMVTRFLGYKTIPYQDWVNNALLAYAQQQPQQSEVSNSPDWVQQLNNMSSDVSSPFSSPTAMNNAVQSIGGYGAIGFDPNATRLQLQQQFQKLGLSNAMTIDANGNISIPNLNYDDPGHFGPFTFGGSEGNDMAGLALIASSVAGGFAGGGGDASGVPAGFGDAGYSGAAGGGAAGGAAGSVAGGSGGGGGGGSGGGGSMGDEGSLDFGDFGVDSTSDSAAAGPATLDTGSSSMPSSGPFDNMSASDIGKFLLQNKGLLGALGGALAGAFKGGSSPAGTVTTTNDVPDWLKPFVQGNVAAGANTLSQINPNNPLLPASQAQALATIRGDYLNPNTNPYLQQNVNDALGLAKSQYLGLYGGPAGLNVNNTGFQEGLTRNLGTVATQAYGQNYANERQNQNTATFGAPQLVSQSNAAYFSPNQAFAGLFPNVSSTQTPYFTNSLGNIFSGALAGGAAAKAFG